MLVQLDRALKCRHITCKILSNPSIYSDSSESHLQHFQAIDYSTASLTTTSLRNILFPNDVSSHMCNFFYSALFPSCISRAKQHRLERNMLILFKWHHYANFTYFPFFASFTSSFALSYSSLWMIFNEKIPPPGRAKESSYVVNGNS